MINGAVWDTATGEIEGFITCPEEQIEAQCGGGKEFFADCPRDATHIINGEPVTLK